MWIAKYSLAQAKQRLERSRRYYASTPEPQRKARYQEYLKILRVGSSFHISPSLSAELFFDYRCRTPNPACCSYPC